MVREPPDHDWVDRGDGLRSLTDVEVDEVTFGKPGRHLAVNYDMAGAIQLVTGLVEARLVVLGGVVIRGQHGVPEDMVTGCHRDSTFPRDEEPLTGLLLDGPAGDRQPAAPGVAGHVDRK